jgi:hypothetical protein
LIVFEYDPSFCLNTKLHTKVGVTFFVRPSAEGGGMAGQDRRAFLIRTGSLLSGISILRFLPAEGLMANPAWQPVDLPTLGKAVLPSELAPEDVQRISNEFRAWLDGFPSEVELSHGWGRASVLYGPPDPGPRWAAQLRELEEAAVQGHNRSFAELSRNQQQALVRTSIASGPVGAGGSPAEAHHIALGFLAFFFRSPEATNLCYRAEINAESCRFLETAGEKPAPLGSGG